MWMTRNLVTIEPAASISAAAALMADNAIRRLPVTHKQGDEAHLLGLVSATDLYRAFPPDHNPFATALSKAPASQVTVEEIMSRELLTVVPETPIEDAATIMRDRKIGALPVVRGDRLIGLITESDIFRAFISVLNAESSGTRVTFSISNGEDVFEQLASETRRRRVQVLSMMSSCRDGQTVCVARMSGPEVDQTIDDLWELGHQVLNVLRWPP
jgi:acetoin utilization protein AcuB